MDISSRDLRPLLVAYVRQHDEAFESETPPEFWLHEASRRCRAVSDGDPASLDSSAIDEVLTILIDGEVDGERIVDRHSATYANWWKALHVLHRRIPQEITESITDLLDESVPLVDRLKTFERRLTPLLESVGEKHEEFTQSINPGKVYGLSTFLLELFYPESYVTYQYRPTRRFFEEYTEYTVQTASDTDLAEQYIELLDGYESVLSELRQLHPDADMHDVHAIIYGRPVLDEFAGSGDGPDTVDTDTQPIGLSAAIIDDLRGVGDSEEGSERAVEVFHHVSDRVGQEFSASEWVETLIWESPSPGSPYIGPQHRDPASSPYLWLGMAHERMAHLGSPTKGLQMEFGIDTSGKSGFFGRDVLCGVYLNARTGDDDLADRVATRVEEHAERLAELLTNDDYLLYLGDYRLETPTADTVAAHSGAVSDGLLLTRDANIDTLLTDGDLGGFVTETFLSLLPYYGDLAGVNDFETVGPAVEAGGEAEGESKGEPVSEAGGKSAEESQGEGKRESEEESQGEGKRESQGGAEVEVDGEAAADPSHEKPSDADQFVRHLEAAKQLILHGPPGTGKTAQAHEFAHWWVEQHPETGRPAEHIDFVSFHPSYAYEDFIEGVTATTEDGDVRYEVADGPFKRICEEANAEYEMASSVGDAPPYVLVIDEINRGNVAELFGEGISLIEPDKRVGQPHEMAVELPHSGDEFTLPPNLYIIGTMNTADRSIALVDSALRRRFRFQLCPPDYAYLRDAYGFDSRSRVESAAAGELTVEGLAARSILALERLNERIRTHLDRGRQIGHSYLLDAHGEPFTEERQFVEAWRYEILPLLEEYYFGQFDRLRREVFDGATLDLVTWDDEQIAAFDAEGLGNALDTLQ